MLVLSRRLGQTICFPTIGAYVQVLAINGGAVRLGIDAPEEVLILRSEVQAGLNLERPVDSGSILCADNS
jgi:carbon storage regulator CsrA